MIVVDASAAFEALLTEEGMKPLARHSLISPPLLWSEVTSALREAVWRKILSKEAATEGLARLGGASIKRRSPKNLHLEAWAVAEELGWAKTYDAEYVALAKLNNCRLLTLDARLERAAGQLIEIVGPTEL